MNILSFIMIGLGVFIAIIAMFFKKAVYNLGKTIKLALLCLCIGVGTLIASIFLNELQQYKMWIILLALLFFWLSYSSIRDVHRCNVKLFAKCTKINTYSGGRGSRSYCPEFQYSYNGKDYLQQTTQSLRKLDDIQIGKTYPVYIWEKNPDHVIYDKKVRFMNVWIGILGLLFIITALCL